jgi:hypothetical protein
MGRHSGLRHLPGTELWSLVACLNVFRAVSKALLNPDRETFTGDAIFDAAVDPVSTTRRKLDSEPADRGAIPNTRMQGIAGIGPRLDGKQILLDRIHEPRGAGQGRGPGMAVLVRQPHDHER